MKAQEAYKIYQLKLDKLDTEDNIDISQGEFVLIYNEIQNKWFERKYREVSTRHIDDVQFLVKSNFNLGSGVVKDNYTQFSLPTNYFDYIRSYSLADKGNCKNRVIYNNEVKLVNLSEHLKDEYKKPSFEYEETILVLSEDKVQVYTTDFSINSVFFTYYRYPKQIDLEGYTKFGIESTNIDPELPDQMVIEVLDMCVTETQRRYSDIEGFQLSKDREQDI